MKTLGLNSRTAIFISGRGSNLKSALEHCNMDSIYVFSNTKKAQGLKWAKRRGVYTKVFSLKVKSDWLSFSDQLNKLKIKEVMLLGFMKLIPKDFLDVFKGRVLNLHPSVLPDFPGLNSIDRSLSQKKATGVSFHIVNEKMDDGPMIYQSSLVLRKDVFNKTDEERRVHFLEQHTVGRYLK
jgi:phosphoribosylglycinamide formyltransferase-1